MTITRKQSTPNFPKKEHFLPPYTHTCVSRGKQCSFFRENWRALFYLNTRIEIRSFVVLLMI